MKKGLGFYCEERWHAGHTCKSPKFFFIEGEQSQSDMDISLEEIVEDDPHRLEPQAGLVDPIAEITLYALLGSPSLGTMRVLGRINSQGMIILIDTSSTHNFLDILVWMSLKLPLSTEASFEVKIANGVMLRTKGACLGVDIKIQGSQSQMDLNVLSLGGCDVVLGT